MTIYIVFGPMDTFFFFFGWEAKRLDDKDPFNVVFPFLTLGPNTHLCCRVPFFTRLTQCLLFQVKQLSWGLWGREIVSCFLLCSRGFISQSGGEVLAKHVSVVQVLQQRRRDFPKASSTKYSLFYNLQLLQLAQLKQLSFQSINFPPYLTALELSPCGIVITATRCSSDHLKCW